MGGGGRERKSEEEEEAPQEKRNRRKGKTRKGRSLNRNTTSASCPILKYRKSKEAAKGKEKKEERKTPPERPTEN